MRRERLTFRDKLAIISGNPAHEITTVAKENMDDVSPGKLRERVLPWNRGLLQ
jgi:hypothetical protein